MPISYCCVVDRAYARYEMNDNPYLSYLHHPSGVTVLCYNIDKSPLTSEVVQVDFALGKKSNQERGEQQVSGKGKKGALLAQKETKLCIIRCKDGTERVVRVGVKGILAEVNDRLRTNPDLVRLAPENQGYIAILTYPGGKRKMGEFTTEVPKKRVFLKEDVVGGTGAESSSTQAQVEDAENGSVEQTTTAAETSVSVAKEISDAGETTLEQSQNVQDASVQSGTVSTTTGTTIDENIVEGIEAQVSQSQQQLLAPETQRDRFVITEMLN